MIGLPGAEVRIDDGKMYIDGSETPLEEDYLKEEWTVATIFRTTVIYLKYRMTVIWYSKNQGIDFKWKCLETGIV